MKLNYEDDGVVIKTSRNKALARCQRCNATPATSIITWPPDGRSDNGPEVYVDHWECHCGTVRYPSAAQRLVRA